MDVSTKKRRAENGTSSPIPPSSSPYSLTLEDAQKIISSFTYDQLSSIVASSMVDSTASVLSSVRSVADKDPTQRKLFIRGLGWDTTTESLRSLFSAFGDLEEAIVICDKTTGKSKGYGFITFCHVDGALLALKDPSKKIDGRMTVTQLAAAGNTGAPTGPPVPAPDVSLRKIYIGNVPPDMPSDRLLALFSSFGEIEEGPLGFDKQTGKFRGYALFVYKSVEAAKAAIEEPTKVVDGHHMICKLAIDGKKPKPGMNASNYAGGVDGNKPGGDGIGVGGPTSLPGSLSSQYGGPGSGLSSYGGFSSGGTGLPGTGGLGHHHLNSPLQSSIGSGLSSVGSQVPSSLGGSGAGGVMGGYGGGFGGPYGSSSQFLGPGSGGYSGLGMGMGSSLYNRQLPESGPYSLSSLGHSGQHHQSAGSPAGPRVPPGGGMYQGMPPYY